MLNTQNDVTHYHFFDQLKKYDFVKTIWLFGSRARGDHSERADIDLALSCPNATTEQWLTLQDVVDQADTLLKIDLIRMDQLKDASPLKQAVLTQGVKLYERV